MEGFVVTVKGAIQAQRGIRRFHPDATFDEMFSELEEIMPKPHASASA